MALRAAILVLPAEAGGDEFRIALQVTNGSTRPISILNPDMGVPSAAARWAYSLAAYRTSLLISFGYLSVKVIDEAGAEVPLEPILSMATPALRPPIELQPGGSLDVVVALGTFYRLEPKKPYRVALEYGDRSLKVAAGARVIVP